MRVNIDHVEKSQGLVFKKKHHGVTLTITFSDEEAAIIEERKLKDTILMERDTPSDVDEEKHANRGLGRKLLNAAVNGRDANFHDLTFNKVLRGPDTYFVATPLEAKQYEAALREVLPTVKAYITENAEIEQKSDSFEL